jgi:hypothetical protein
VWDDKAWVATCDFRDGEPVVATGDTAEQVKLLAERWYAAKVLMCLDPLDELSSCQIVTQLAQCGGEMDG